MLATDVDDDLPTTVPALSGLNGNTESTMRILPIPALVDVPFVSRSILDPITCVVQESTEVDVSGTVIDGHESVAGVFPIRAMPAGVRATLRSIHDWDLNVIFQRRANVVK